MIEPAENSENIPSPEDGAEPTPPAEEPGGEGDRVDLDLPTEDSPPPASDPSEPASLEPVGAGVVCRKCAYQLQGLSPAGRCPECGTPVAFSLESDQLQFAEPTWLMRLRKGASLCLIGALVSGVPTAIHMALTLLSNAGRYFGAQFSAPQFVYLGMELIGFAGTLIGFIGLWRLTTPDPIGLGEDRYGRSRKITRVMAIASLAGTIVSTASRFSPSFSFIIGVNIVVGIGAIAGSIEWFAEFRFLTAFCLRLPSKKMSRRAKMLMFAVPGSVVFFVIALALAEFEPGGRYRLMRITYSLLLVAASGATAVFYIQYIALLGNLMSRLQQLVFAANRAWKVSAAADHPTA